MRIDVVHQRDPDSECCIDVYVDGQLVEHHEWSFDPGAGMDMDEFEENKAEDIESAPDFLKPILEQIWDDMSGTYEKYAL